MYIFITVYKMLMSILQFDVLKINLVFLKLILENISLFEIW